MSQRPAPPRGMRDILPQQVRRRRFLQQRILETFESFGFEQVETPAVEDLDRLLDSEAGDNAKLIYKVLRRGLDWKEAAPADEAAATDLGLRYDLTVPLARFFATNQAELPVPFKAIQIGPVYRAERPQKGRYRQFTQCDIDVIGAAGVITDAELVCATALALRACGVIDFAIRMNHRRVLNELLRYAGFAEASFPAVLVIVDKLDKIGIEGVRQELDVLNPEAASKLTDVLGRLSGDSPLADFLSILTADSVSAATDLYAIRDAVRESVKDVEVYIDPSLVRGQGYYTGAIFEIVHAELGGSLAGGGRYDNMVKKLSGIDVPASGMSIGFERLDGLLESRHIETRRNKIAVLYPADAAPAAVLEFAQTFRSGDSKPIVRVQKASKNRGAQLTALAVTGFTQMAEFPNPELRELKRDNT